MYSRAKAVALIRSWLGMKESDGSFKPIIDTYNTFKPHPRGIAMQYSWAWCACTVSAVAIKLGYTAIMPVEISCFQLIRIAQSMGIWIEDDSYRPLPGDLVLYDWSDTAAYSKNDNIGSPDHVGMVVETYPSSGYFVVIEGNYNDSVKIRTVSYNGRYIRGFIAPKYDEDAEKPVLYSGLSLSDVAHEVISGKWGDSDIRRAKLRDYGYDVAAVQAEVNRILNGSAETPSSPVQDFNQPTERKVTASCGAKRFDKSYAGTYRVTASSLYLRNDAGTNKKSLALLPSGLKVQCHGYFNYANYSRWLYVEAAMDGTLYTGFCHSDFLDKV